MLVILQKKQEKFIGDKYDYSKVEYVNNSTKVCIICPIHGEFWQTPNKHLGGQGCKECSKVLIGEKNKKYTTKTFIEKCITVHGTKLFDYKDTKYINPKTKIKIFCNIHKEYFYIMPYAHLNGQGCPKCKNKKISDSKKRSVTDFIEKARKVHR